MLIVVASSIPKSVTVKSFSTMLSSAPSLPPSLSLSLSHNHPTSHTNLVPPPHYHHPRHSLRRNRRRIANQNSRPLSTPSSHHHAPTLSLLHTSRPHHTHTITIVVDAHIPEGRNSPRSQMGYCNIFVVVRVYKRRRNPLRLMLLILLLCFIVVFYYCFVRFMIFWFKRRER